MENKQSIIVNKILNSSEEQLSQFLDEITDFDDLHYFMEATTKFDKAARKDKGFRDSFTKIYDDRTHFIYELLQNAEDANATCVYFKLNENSLEFKHNGTEIFTLDDIKGITGWGNSTKKEDTGTKIGKFGIGFKSVYGYTDEPEIYSRDYNFKIKDFFVPERIPAKEHFDASSTLFILPFNYRNKSASKAYEEIKKGLNDIKPETLLFLNRIKKLEWEIENNTYCVEKEQDGHTFSIFKDGELIVKYLRFDGKAQYYDKERQKDNILPISLAYKLSLEKDKTIIREDDNCNVYTFFKVKNEYAKLHYLINALFELTQARDKLVSDSEINEEILSQIADLQIETMEYLRDNGYLTTDFLGVLPNSKDQLSEMYKVFHKKLVDLFNDKDFTPTMSGEFRPASELYKGSSMYTNGPHIAEFISDKELNEMLEAEDDKCKYVSEPPLWVRNTLQNSPADLFLQDLDLNEFGVEEFYEWFDNGWQNGEQIRVWKSIVEQKDFTSLARLYRMLLQYFENNENVSCWAFNYFSIFRCTDGNMYTLNDNLFIQPENGWHKELLNNYHFIDNKSFGVSQQKNKILELFKDYFGIEEFSIETLDQEEFERLRTKYSQNDLTTNDISISKHIEDIKFLLQYYKNRSNYTMGYFEIQNKLEEMSFILTTDNRYVSVDRTYSDMRYGNDNDLMKEAKDILGLSEINIKYKEKLSGKQVNEFIDMINSIGVRKQLWYIPCKDNPQKKYASYWYTDLSSETEDYDISSLQEIIDNVRHNPKLSKLIWLSILSFPDWLAREACYRRNRRYDREFMPMQYVYTLSKSAWILDRNGYLQKPEDMTFDDLPINENWKRPAEYYEHPILKAIGFGKNTQQQREEQQRKDQVAKSVGFENAHEVEELKKLRDEMKEAGVTNEEVRNFIQRRQEKGNKPLPESASKNPERRQVKVSDEYENASEQV
jgi:hypothetical protein